MSTTKSASHSARSGRNNISDKLSLWTNQRKDNSFGRKSVVRPNASEPSSLSVEYLSENDLQVSQSMENLNGSIQETFPKERLSGKDGAGVSPFHVNLCRDGIQDKVTFATFHYSYSSSRSCTRKSFLVAKLKSLSHFDEMLCQNDWLKCR